MTKSKNAIVNMVIAALLCAIGILIPMVFPKLIIGPMSFTPASHVPVFLAAMISPPVAIIVSLGTALGFFFSATPVIALRALSHIIFATAGALWLKKHPLNSFKNYAVFASGTALLHAFFEFIVVCFFYFGGSLTPGFYESGFFISMVVLVFGGTIAHSTVDFFIAVAIAKPLEKLGMIHAFTPVPVKSAQS